MPRFEPFRAYRYDAGVDLDRVIAPPYDVLSAADVEALGQRDEHNIVHIDVPTGDESRYAAAADVLAEWLMSETLVQDEDPSFTIYRMSFTDPTGQPRTIVGVLGGLEVVDEGAGGVLPHEQTTPKASSDRLDLMRATAANTSPVWGLSLAAGLSELLAAPGAELGRIHVEGVDHVVERVTDPGRIAAIRDVIGSDDVLIADGHHRYGVSRTYRDELRTRTGLTDTEAELTLAFVNELVSEQLSIEAIHRLYRGIGLEELRAILARSFELESAPAPGPHLLADMVSKGRLVLLSPEGSAEWLIPKEGAFEGVRALDGAYLEHALAGSPAEVEYQHGLEGMLARVGNDGVTAGVLIRPTSLAEIERTAREGLLMPPKSTFFTPKLRTGFVIRPTAPLPSE